MQYVNYWKNQQLPDLCSSADIDDVHTFNYALKNNYSSDIQ